MTTMKHSVILTLEDRTNSKILLKTKVQVIPQTTRKR